MKYIDAEKLIAEIERQRVLFEYNGKTPDERTWRCLGELISFINSLQQEQPEVDLEKEYKEYVEDNPVFSILTNRNVGLAIARHFYELGASKNK